MAEVMLTTEISCFKIFFHSPPPSYRGPSWELPRDSGCQGFMGVIATSQSSEYNDAKSLNGLPLFNVQALCFPRFIYG